MRRFLEAARLVRVVDRDDLVRIAKAEGRLWKLPPLDQGPPDPVLTGPVRPVPELLPGTKIQEGHPTEGAPPFVAEINGVRLSGMVPLALTPNGRVIKQVLISSDNDDGRLDRAIQDGIRAEGMGQTLRRLRRRAPEPALELECATVLSGRANVYYHFVCDQLTKLAGSRHTRPRPGSCPPLCCHSGRRAGSASCSSSPGQAPPSGSSGLAARRGSSAWSFPRTPRSRRGPASGCATGSGRPPSARSRTRAPSPAHVC